MKKKITTVVMFFMILFGTENVMAGNGIKIIKDSSSNRIDLYCEYGNGDWVKVVRDTSGDTGDWELSDGLSVGNTCIGGTASDDCLKSLLMVDSDGNLDCPLYMYGQVQSGSIKLASIQGFSNTAPTIDGITSVRLNPSHSVCEGVCKLENQKTEVELNTFTCDYVGQKTGKKLKIEGKGSRDITITYPDGNTKKSSNVSYTSSCPDLYYILNSEQDPLVITKSNSGVSPTLESICRTHSYSDFDQFCVGSCDSVQLNCPGVKTETVDACNVELPAALPTFVSNIIKTLKILVPILLIVMGMIDFARAVIANDEKQMKESQNRFIRRIIAAVIIFFVVAIVQLIFNTLSPMNEVTGCLNCFINGKCNITVQS